MKVSSMKKKQSKKKIATNNTIPLQAMFWGSVAMLLVSSALLISAVRVQNQSEFQHGVKAKPFTVGSAIQMGTVDVSVEKVSYSPGQRSFTAPAGKKYMIVDFYVKNRSDKPIQVLPSKDTYLKDSRGNVVYLSPAILDNPFRSGELLPGEQIKGQLSYLVSQDTKYTLYIDAPWSGGVLPVAID